MITLTIVIVMRLPEHHKVFALAPMDSHSPLYSLDLFTTKGIEHYRKTIKVAKQNYPPSQNAQFITNYEKQGL
jgi:hypothetical protein